jgi:hypothetical protein
MKTASSGEKSSVHYVLKNFFRHCCLFVLALLTSQAGVGFSPQLTHPVYRLKATILTEYPSGAFPASRASRQETHEDEHNPQRGEVAIFSFQPVETVALPGTTRQQLRLNRTACQSTCEHPLARRAEAVVVLAGQGINKSVVDFAHPTGDDAIGPRAKVVCRAVALPGLLLPLLVIRYFFRRAVFDQPDLRLNTAIPTMGIAVL